MRESDDLGTGVLRLKQERREIRALQRMLHRAEHLAAAALDDIGRVALHRGPESEIGGQEKPGVVALLEQGPGAPAGEGIDVPGPMDADGRARLARQIGGARPGYPEDTVGLLGDLQD